MGTAVKTGIVKIGNSQGIRIPKLLLKQSGIHEEVEIEVQGDCLTIRTAQRWRAGWDEAFAEIGINLKGNGSQPFLCFSGQHRSYCW